MDCSDKKIWGFACGMLDGYGPGATAAAERCARARLGKDDVVGHGVWLLVAEACREMLRRPRGEWLH
jgi:hypothetical protein